MERICADWLVALRDVEGNGEGEALWLAVAEVLLRRD